MSAPVRLSAAQARRLALRAQGFTDPRPAGRVDRRHVHRVLARVGVVQIDSVNVVARSHELPLYARLGAHPRNALVDASHRREVFEYWGHEASFIPVELQPLFRHRMEAAAGGAAWSGLVELARRRPGFVEQIHREVIDRGPLSAAELSDGGGRSGPWWGWSETKRALEWLFWCGRLGARRRRGSAFEREYAAPELLLPADVLARPTPARDEAERSLLLLAARSCGVGTAADLADYFRLRVPTARIRLEELVEDERLVAAEVDGWRHRAYLWPDVRPPRRVRARALLSPFDSLVWNRHRAERLFGFRYRLEFYTPAPKRTFGYYVMPFLLDETLPARVDVKADRRSGRLLVSGAFAEQGAGLPPAAAVAAELAAELYRFAGFLGLGGVEVAQRGDLAGPLAAAVGARRGYASER